MDALVFFIFLSECVTKSLFNNDDDFVEQDDDDFVEQASEQASEQADEFMVFAIDPCQRGRKPLPVKHGFLPVFYQNKWNGTFQSNIGHIVSEADININLEGLPNMISYEQHVVIMRPKTYLQEMEIEMKEGPGWKWDALEMCYTKVSQPDGENYGWNEQLQEYAELCKHYSGYFKPNWDNWICYPLIDHDASKMLFGKNGGMYSTHKCLCDGCGEIFNPTDHDELRQHSFQKKSSTVRPCDDMYDVGQ